MMIAEVDDHVASSAQGFSREYVQGYKRKYDRLIAEYTVQNAIDQLKYCYFHIISF